MIFLFGDYVFEEKNELVKLLNDGLYGSGGGHRGNLGGCCDGGNAYLEGLHLIL